MHKFWCMCNVACVHVTGTVITVHAIWVGNKFSFCGMEILVARKWVDKIFDAKHVDDRLLMIELILDNCYRQIAAIVSTFTPQQWPDKFYKDLSPLSPNLVKRSWSWLMVTSTDMSGKMQVVMMELISLEKLEKR